MTITATTSDGAGGTVSDTAQLTIQIPLVINEILADVVADNSSTTVIEGDANRDGVRDADDDEFVELFNNSNAPVDLSGVVITDATNAATARFTFPQGTTLAAGRAVVVFGGAQASTFNASDPAFGGALVLFVPGTGTLSLNDTGDTVMVKLAVAGIDTTIAAVTYGGSGNTVPAPSDQSLTRSPNAEIGTTGGDFVAHSSATNASGRIFSPGTRADGTPFGSPAITRIEVAPASAAINIGATQAFTARAFSNASGTEIEVPNVSFIFDSSSTAIATIAPTTGTSTIATAVSAGSTTVRARAGAQRGTATLSVNPPPQTLTRIELTPTSASIVVGGTQQFTARAFDQNNQEISGVTFTYTSSNTSVATINQNGLATSANAGTTQITASSGNTTSNAATLTVTAAAASPATPTAGQVIINEALVAFATSTTQTRNDFVELFNTTNQALDISGLVISFRGAGNVSAVSTAALPGAVGSGTTLIQPQSYFLIVNGSQTFGAAADFDASSAAFDLNNSTGGIKIEISGNKLDGLAYQGSTTAPSAIFAAFGEGAIFNFASGTTNDLIRSPNAADTNNNLNDFRRNGTLTSVTPKTANPTIP